MTDPIRLTIRAASGAYPVLVGRGVTALLPSLLEELHLRGRLRVVADERVIALQGRGAVQKLADGNRELALLEISGQERDKNLATVSRIYDWLVDVGTDRTDLIVALGGGVVGDMVGFAAATYLRGVRLIHIPTTLLAMVDSSIGGKTGVDHPRGKNLIGAFHQPSLVLADLDFLRTLPRRELVAGWAEVIKMGVIRSADLFERLELTAEALLELGPEAAGAIGHAIRLKGEVIAADEREADQRMILNYGHTIGHAIEAATEYERYLHGEAVAIGMEGAAMIAERLGLLAPETRARQTALLERFGLPLRCPGLTPAALWDPLRRDKKAVGSRLRWILPTTIGSVRILDNVPESLVEGVLQELSRS